MNTDIERETIIGQLKELNTRVARQNSVLRVFSVGIVYGVGFFVGSAVIATIALGVFGPYISQIPWVHNAFETGLSLLKN